jgi:hypothetical protein
MARVPLEHTLALTCSYLDLGEARARQILAMFTARSAAQSGPATSVQQERECSSTIEHALLKHRKLMQSDPTCTVIEMVLPMPLWHFVIDAAPLVSRTQACFCSFVTGQLRIRRRRRNDFPSFRARTRQYTESLRAAH